MTDQPKKTILIVDNDIPHCTMMRNLLIEMGYSVYDVYDGDTALQNIYKHAFDLIFIDINVLGSSEDDILSKIKSLNPLIPIIIVKNYSSSVTEEEIVKNEVYAYITKPIDYDLLRITVGKAIDYIVTEKNHRSDEILKGPFDRMNFIGKCAAIEDILKTVSRISKSEANILINGESGTGKGKIAELVHYNSHRKDGRFITIRYAVLVENLMETALFGYKRDRLTGGSEKGKGLFLQAHRGSLFFDEISEIPLAVQAKLINVIQEKKITTTDPEKEVGVDVRVIAATNKDLLQEVKAGRFLEDLYYLLSVVTLTIPSLRDRPEDIPLLCDHYLKYFSVKANKRIKGFTPQAISQMIRYDWPGNIKELMSVIEGAVYVAQSEYLNEEGIRLQSKKDHAVKGKVDVDDVSDAATVKEIEKTTILETLELTENNKSEAARRLGITRKTLHKKLKKHGLMIR